MQARVLPGKPMISQNGVTYRLMTTIVGMKVAYSSLMLTQLNVSLQLAKLVLFPSDEFADIARVAFIVRLVCHTETVAAAAADTSY